MIDPLAAVDLQDWHRAYTTIPPIYFKFSRPCIPDGSLLYYSPNSTDKTNLLPQINYHTVEWIQKQGQVIVDTTTDPITKAGFQERRRLLEPFDIENHITWVTDDLELESLYSNVVSWPRDLACSSYRLQKHYHPEVRPGHRQHNLSCLNRQFRAHRAYLYYLLQQREYFEKSIISHRAYVHSYNGQTMTLEHPWFDEIPSNIRENMRKINLYRESSPGDNQWKNDHSFVHPAYSDTYLNIITESIVNPGVYFSEKMFKPLAAGQLFLLVGCAGSLQHLRLLGIECFDYSMGEHSYDHDPQWQHRVEKLMTFLDEIYSAIPDIYHDNFNKIEHNWYWVRSADFLAQCEKSLRARDLIHKSVSF